MPEESLHRARAHRPRGVGLRRRRVHRRGLLPLGRPGRVHPVQGDRPAADQRHRAVHRLAGRHEEPDADQQPLLRQLGRRVRHRGLVQLPVRAVRRVRRVPARPRCGATGCWPPTTTYDYTLFTVENFAAVQKFGYLTLDTARPAQGPGAVRAAAPGRRAHPDRRRAGRAGRQLRGRRQRLRRVRARTRTSRTTATPRAARPARRCCPARPTRWWRCTTSAAARTPASARDLLAAKLKSLL